MGHGPVNMPNQRFQMSLSRWLLSDSDNTRTGSEHWILPSSTLPLRLRANSGEAKQTRRTTKVSRSRCSIIKKYHNFQANLAHSSMPKSHEKKTCLVEAPTEFWKNTYHAYTWSRRAKYIPRWIHQELHLKIPWGRRGTFCSHWNLNRSLSIHVQLFPLGQ